VNKMNEKNRAIYKKEIKNELTLIKNGVNMLESIPINEQIQIIQIIDNCFHSMLFDKDFDMTSFYEGKQKVMEALEKAETDRINFYKTQFDKLYGDL